MLKFSFIFNKYLNAGHIRSASAKKNILQLILIKFSTIAASFLLIPMTIKYVSPTEYGIWLVISSTVAWMSIFDIGINNGLRNKLSESLARKDYDRSKSLVSTAYFLLAIIFIPLLVMLMAGNYLVDWVGMLNLQGQNKHDLKTVAAILMAYFCIRFILSTINTILLADQSSAQAGYTGLFEQLSLLLLVYLLTKFINGSLVYLASALFISSMFVMILASVWFFFGKFKKISPSIKYIDRRLVKDIFSIGIKFFIIQIAGVIQFQTANIILIRYYGPAEVTEYNIVQKYFSLMPMFMAILLSPIWSAVTDAYAKKEYEWIHKTVSDYNKVAVVIIGTGLLMLLGSDYMYKVWINDSRISIDFYLSVWMYIFSALMVYGSIYSIVLNGLGNLNIQFISCMISPVVFIAMIYFLIEFYDVGITAIVISSIVANFNGYILGPWQYKRLKKLQQYQARS